MRLVVFFGLCDDGFAAFTLFGCANEIKNCMERVALADIGLMLLPDAAIKDLIKECSKKLDEVISPNPQMFTRENNAYIYTFRRNDVSEFKSPES
jgi:hypothetical protein